MPPKNALDQKLIDLYDTFLFDGDGTLWHFDDIIDNSNEVIRTLIDQGKQVIIVSNNSAVHPRELAQKCQQKGFYGISVDNVVTTTQVAAFTLAAEPKVINLPVYLIGSQSLADELANRGIKSVGVGPDPPEKYNPVDNLFINAPYEDQIPVSAVIIGYDLHVNYVKIQKACNYLCDPAVEFFVTEADTEVPSNRAIKIPWTGSFSAAVEKIVGRKGTILGKPSKNLFKYLKNTYNLNPARTLMIGDRLNTDIAFGNNNGLHTLLVQTGAHKVKDVEHEEQQGHKEHVPTYIGNSVQVIVGNEGTAE